MSLKTIMLHVYQLINTQHTVAGEVFTSSINSVTYGHVLYKLFIVSILGTRLLGQKKYSFRTLSTEVQATVCSKGL